MPHTRCVVLAVSLLSFLVAFAGVAVHNSRSGVASRFLLASVDRSRALGDAAGGDVEGREQDRELAWRWGGNGSGKRRARLAFLIMSSGDEIDKLELLLPEIYHPNNIYLVHVDAKTSQQQTERIREVVQRVFPAKDDRPSNGRLLEPAGIVSWGGFSITLACLYGIAAALLWDDGWDYFINLSTSDFPVMTQEDMALFLGEHADAGVSFLDGGPMRGFERRWQGYTEDQGMQRDAETFTSVAMKTLGGIERPYPQLFRLYKGEFWGIFHRSFCEYASWSPDNVARSLLGYFTGYRVSDESYFQTLACHAEGKEFPIHGDNFRFASWNEHHHDGLGRKVDENGNILIHPEPIGMVSLERVKSSGALFARKFDYVKSREVYSAMQVELRNRDKSDARRDRATARFRQRASGKKGRESFCGEPGELARERELLEGQGRREGDDLAG